MVPRIGRPRENTKESCLASAKQHQTKQSWQQAEPKFVSAARRHGWYTECTLHMQPPSPASKRKWTKEKCGDSALNYTNVSEWKENDVAAYSAAKRYGWLKEITQHFVPLGNKIKRFIYIIRVKNTNMVYVGLTKNIAKRWSVHLTSTRFLEIQKDFGPNCLRLFTCRKLFKAEDAASLEDDWIIKYKSRGFTTLNKKQGGGLGASSSIWNYEAVRKDAKNYDFIGTWSIESHAAYTSALNNGWLEQLVSNGIIARKVKPHGFWTKERIKNSALGHPTRKKWQEEDPKAYSAAAMAGLLNDLEVTQHFVRSLKWTDENLRAEVSKYETIKALRAGSPVAYSTLKKQKKLKEFTAELKRARRPDPWSKSEILSTAKQFDKRADFHIFGKGAYQAAKRMGVFEKATQHMVGPAKKH